MSRLSKAFSVPRWAVGPAAGSPEQPERTGESVGEVEEPKHFLDSPSDCDEVAFGIYQMFAQETVKTAESLRSPGVILLCHLKRNEVSGTGL